MKSRCSATCQRCWWAGPRDATYRESSEPAGFRDVCPMCGSDDVDVEAPMVVRRSDNSQRKLAS